MRMHRLACGVFVIQSAGYNNAVTEQFLFCLTQEKVKCWRVIGAVTGSLPPAYCGCHPWQCLRVLWVNFSTV